jgi:hypothetical protein
MVHGHNIEETEVEAVLTRPLEDRLSHSGPVGPVPAVRDLLAKHRASEHA